MGRQKQGICFPVAASRQPVALLYLTGVSLSKKTVTVMGNEPVEKIADKWRDNNEYIQDFPGSAKIFQNV